MCFNPRARTGRDDGAAGQDSIHRRFNPRARTGRDVVPDSIPLRIGMFQSTRPHGARRVYFLYNSRIITVSIHAPARGATIFQYSRQEWDDVSIHAPARGATMAIFYYNKSKEGFNPRARTGRDRKAVIPFIGHEMFQSTRPHGARPVSWGTRCRLLQVSIHAPARGATN